MSDGPHPLEIHDHKVNDFNKHNIRIIAHPQQGEQGDLRRDLYRIETPYPGQHTTAVIEIRFQNGSRHAGITNEALVAIVLDRLRNFQDSPYRCRQNALAITKLEESLHWLRDRATERRRRNVEGTQTV